MWVVQEITLAAKVTPVVGEASAPWNGIHRLRELLDAEDLILSENTINKQK
jgi:hypothetical protein